MRHAARQFRGIARLRLSRTREAADDLAATGADDAPRSVRGASLYYLGQARMRLGDAEGARAALARIEEQKLDEDLVRKAGALLRDVEKIGRRVPDLDDVAFGGGRPTALLFFRAGHGDGLDDLKALAALARARPGALRVVAVTVDGDVAAAKLAIQAAGVAAGEDLIVRHDEGTGRLAGRWNPPALPWVYLLDGETEVRATGLRAGWVGPALEALGPAPPGR